MNGLTRREMIVGSAAMVQAGTTPPDEFALMDATAQAELVRNGKVSPLDLVDAAIRRIEKSNPQLNAVIWERFEQARQEARSRLPRGPFTGVPILIKDLGCASQGEPEFQGSRFLKNNNYRAPKTTELARRIKAAGFITLGRTNAPEFAMVTTTEPLAWGPTRNPWDMSRTPGGSSGGSGTAVAALFTPVAQGGDAGGSIRIPAAACGLVGLKVTRGRISQSPGDEVTVPLAVQGFLSRSVRDTAACLDFSSGQAPGDPTPPPISSRPYIQDLFTNPGKLRIGLLNRMPGSVEGELDSRCKKAVEDAGHLLESLGHHVELAGPPGIDDPQMTVTYTRLLSSRGLHVLNTFEQRIGRRARNDEIEPASNAFLGIARGMTAEDYMQALDKRNVFSRQFASWWGEGFDILLTPSTGNLTPKLGTLGLDGKRQVAMLRWSAFMRFYNFSGQPAISLPLYESDDGLPVGVQLGAPYGREDMLISLAGQLERARPWAARFPTLAFE